ncbi:hypothetical protein CAPTEDRAFT_207606 [Capitella teleta]|uniref:F-box domain-containing protein n=1 Tax=Capitella teleta TaxID=283909 RepID=R7TX59_CAPTE|nr:hypothetical protein CAPTEDRAFT_207606 [Capitella teleta]|eukprot:ELT98513.1 hypothetical protein CAPTEDRAFT_207606 [Capitella teleta]
MAPYVPEEVDVFSVPHSRMKALVDEYSQMLRTTNFSNDVDHQLLLESLYRTFVEFKTHEQIENRFIMRRLKAKLKRLSIQDSAVCNCHKDNVLLDMLGFIKDGFQKKTEQDRINYGRRLKELLESFTHSFLPHMKEEEEVFQPLLLQHFSYEELCELKQNVINQHIMRKRSPEHGSDKLEKWVSEDSREDSASDVEEEVKPDASFCNLPPEISLKIFGYLGPQDLCRAAQVSREWNSFCLEPCLWSRILPVQWAHGQCGH